MRFFFFMLVLLGTMVSHAQNFSERFVGHWQGELQWFQIGKKEPQKVKMQLIIQPADTAGQYTWQIIYGEKNEDNRPYLLKPVDTAKGHWIIDERNGIILDQYRIGNRFTGAFTVQNATIINSYWLESGRLIAEFYNISAKPVSASGGTGDDVPAVNSYATRSYQKAILKKKAD